MNIVRASNVDSAAVQHGFALRAHIVDARINSTRIVTVASVSVLVLIMATFLIGGFLTQKALIDRVLGSAMSETIPVDSGAGTLPRKIAGSWVAKDGTRILISRSGTFWSEDGDLLGEASVDRSDATHFVFSGPGFRCVYKVTVSGNTSSWALTDRSPNTACPTGTFVRLFTF